MIENQCLNQLVAKSSTSFSWDDGWKVTAAGCQGTL